MARREAGEPAAESVQPEQHNMSELLLKQQTQEMWISANMLIHDLISNCGRKYEVCHEQNRMDELILSQTRVHC